MPDCQNGRPRTKNIPDLLSAEPLYPPHMADLISKCQFAFSSGESAGALREFLGRTPLAPSDWDESCFGRDLYLDELIEKCLTISKERFSDDYVPPQSRDFLKKVLTHPPCARASVRFRQEIQKELLDDEKLLSQFELVYRRLTELREVLDSTAVLGTAYTTLRRIDILHLIKETVDFAAEQFDSARSGIVRIRLWAKEFQHTPGYAMLRDFVEYERKFSNIHLSLQVGLDGTVRSLRIERIAEGEQSRFYRNPISRFWSWFRLFVRGYQIGLDELVARIVERVFDGIDEPLSHLLVLIGHMQCHLASIAFFERCRKSGLEACYPTFEKGSQGRSARGLFNPLLLDLEDDIVPCDVDSDREDAVFIITGPNSGGKTRLLQAVGLMQILGQNGFAAPARKATLHYKRTLFASLIENQSANHKEDRLGMELLRIRKVFESSSSLSTSQRSSV